LTGVQVDAFRICAEAAVIFVDVDVQIVRGVAWAALDESYGPRGGGLLAAAEQLQEISSAPTCALSRI
jgi:hypothetical protein